MDLKLLSMGINPMGGRRVVNAFDCSIGVINDLQIVSECALDNTDPFCMDFRSRRTVDTVLVRCGEIKPDGLGNEDTFISIVVDSRYRCSD